MKNILMLISLVIVFSSCSLYHVNSEDITTDFYHSKRSANDVMYVESIDQPYEVIGYVTINTERNQRITEVIDNMKREAAMKGADAITNIKSDSTGVWKQLPAQEIIGNGYVRANFTAAMVVFK